MEEIKVEQEVKVTKDLNLAEKYDDFHVEPIVMRGGYKVYEHGSRGLTKMLNFKKENEFGNNEIDYWMEIKPPRQEDEIGDKYKKRLRFQQALYKYRKYIYSFPKESIKKLKRLTKKNVGIAYAD